MKTELLSKLPKQWPHELTGSIRQSLLESKRTIVVLDDDPTGTQTVYDVPVLTRYDLARLASVLLEGPPVLFLLTNSRAMTASQTEAFHSELAEQLKTASSQTQRKIEVVSRSDSTLRGHFPLETDTLARHWPDQAEIVLLMPFFLEGGRFTLHGQHFVAEGVDLVPAHETPFAQDAVFGFKNSWMPKYVEEKTGGRVKADDVITIPIEVIRQEGPAGVCRIFDAAPIGSVCIADGVTDRDVQVVAAAVSQTSKNVLARVAASYVRARAGLANRPLLTSAELRGEGSGGLVVVGSHVPKSTTQLNFLLRNQPNCLTVELNVDEVLKSGKSAIARLVEQVTAGLKSNRDVVLFTSRELVLGNDDATNLRIAKVVSSSLVSTVKQLSVRPRYLIAKGGITSSDIATAGLGVERAQVVGSILPGVPVWQLGDETKFPGLHYVIFPGNVGGDDALNEAVMKLKEEST